MIVRNALLVVLVVVAAIFIFEWRKAAAWNRPSIVQLATGFVTDFFDTLGIGSLATTTTAYKMLHMVSDERIVGTIIVGHAVPIVVNRSERVVGNDHVRCTW